MVPLSLLKTIYYILTNRLKFPDMYMGKILRMDDRLQFRVFRHMKLLGGGQTGTEALFVVRFRFKKFSHEKNIRLSRIPIPLIAGFPGFRDKVWMIDYDSGFWQGVYQWESPEAIEKYKKSFVLKLMNMRAVEDSLWYETIPGMDLSNYIRNRSDV